MYVIEALAAGVPVVQPDHGHFPELLARTGGGVLFPPGDADQLASEIANLLENPGVRQKLGNEGREKAANMASSSQMAEETLKVIKHYKNSLLAGDLSD